MCGVLPGVRAREPGAGGSSPHVRGFERGRIPLTMRSRFIPACAGFWPNSHGKAGNTKVHPRMCGVLCQKRQCPLVMPGSSPHVRGFAQLWILPVRRAGFIPACAGFWLKSVLWKYPTQVHPRMCGVLCVRSARDALSRGSSPHVRGFGIPQIAKGDKNGFIPACAGFWPSGEGGRFPYRVHPRMCGVLIEAVKSKKIY